MLIQGDISYWSNPKCHPLLHNMRRILYTLSSSLINFCAEEKFLRFIDLIWLSALVKIYLTKSQHFLGGDENLIGEEFQFFGQVALVGCARGTGRQVGLGKLGVKQYNLPAPGQPSLLTSLTRLLFFCFTLVGRGKRCLELAHLIYQVRQYTHRVFLPEGKYRRWL